MLLRHYVCLKTRPARILTNNWQVSGFTVTLLVLLVRSTCNSTDTAMCALSRCVAAVRTRIDRAATKKSTKATYRTFCLLLSICALTAPVHLQTTVLLSLHERIQHELTQHTSGLRHAAFGACSAYIGTASERAHDDVGGYVGSPTRDWTTAQSKFTAPIVYRLCRQTAVRATK